MLTSFVRFSEIGLKAHSPYSYCSDPASPSSPVGLERDAFTTESTNSMLYEELLSLQTSGDVELYCSIFNLNIPNRYGFDISFQDANGLTLLHHAVIHALNTGNNDFIGILLAEQIDINKADVQGRTALHYAFAEAKTLDAAKNIASYLLKNGADASILDKAGKTPMQLHFKLERQAKPPVTESVLIVGHRRVDFTKLLAKQRQEACVTKTAMVIRHRVEVIEHVPTAIVPCN
jgi:hypothetical protein